MMTDPRYATPFTMLHAASLLGQRSRLNKFRQAIQEVVKEGDYVVDFGTGSGVLAIMAAKAGAARVTAVEVNPESLHYAEEAAKMNGVEQIIEFVEGNFSDFVPTEKVDVVICEMLSSMMLVEQQIPASLHATTKVLKPDGVILPQTVTIYVVPVECPEIWERFQYDGLEFPRVVQTATQDATRDLAEMAVLETYNLKNLGQDSTINKTLQFTIGDKGTVHGLVGVFESTLFRDIELKMEDGWKQLFIPLTQPIDVDVGEVFTIQISYKPGKYDSLSIEVL